VIEIWEPEETTTHQDHVIAHVIGASVSGYFVFDEVLYILLDIGFIWAIFLDGQMTLMPHPVAIRELEAGAELREGIKKDVGILLGDYPDLEELLQMKPSPVPCQIKDVSFSKLGPQSRLILLGEESNLAIVTSLENRETAIHEF
jgi:hypothetical protein